MCESFSKHRWMLHWRTSLINSLVFGILTLLVMALVTDQGTHYFSRIKFWARQQQLRHTRVALLAQVKFRNIAVVRFAARHLPEEGGVSDDSHEHLLLIKEPLDEPLDARKDCQGADVFMCVHLLELEVLVASQESSSGHGNNNSVSFHLP